jgi:hypothetical protein
MTDQELIDRRRDKWRLNGNPIRTLEDAQEFIESVGFCLMFPVRTPTPMLVPTFIGAYAGTDDNLPTAQHAYKDPRTAPAIELMVRLLRTKHAFEANLFGGDNVFLVSASVFPFFYALVGDRNPLQMPRPGKRSEYSPLARDVYEIITKAPASKPKLRETIGQEYADTALDRALNELWSRLRITRIDYREHEGGIWDVLYRWSLEPVKEAINLSVPEALSALISKYLDCTIAADHEEVTEFFSHFVGRSRVSEALNALLGAREFEFVQVGTRSAIQVTPPRTPVVPRQPRQPRPVTGKVPTARPDSPSTSPAPENGTSRRSQPLVPRDKRGGRPQAAKPKND